LPAKEISVEEFDRMRKSPSVTIIDVREFGELPVVDEFEHLQIPLSMLDAKAGEGEGQIILFCQSGKRSVQAAGIMSAANQSAELYSLKGGIVQWKKHQHLIHE
jgi:adenylyltransferase/sulfurtransferase